MKNAHERLAELRFRKITRETSLDVRSWLDRLIAEPASGDQARCRAHLISVFGSEQEIAAINAAVIDESAFEVYGPGLPRLYVTLGPEAEVFRGSINVPGRRRAVRHLVAISKELALTRTSADLKARRTVLVSDDPRFMLYRIGIRFGLPVLCEWSDWFAAEIARRDAMRPLIGFGCRPVMISGTKRRFLGWMGHALKRQAIHIPSVSTRTWELPEWFPAPQEAGQLTE